MVDFTKDPVPKWLRDMENPAVINALAAAGHGAATIPSVNYDSVTMAAGVTAGEDPLVGDFIITAQSPRATEVIVDWGDGNEDLLALTPGVSTITASHEYADTVPVTVTGSNNVGQSDTVAFSPQD